MNNKNLILLGVAAVVLGGAAFFLSRGTATRAPALNGQPLVRPFDVEQVAQIQIGDKLALVAGDDGWIVPAATNAPADRAKITENLLKLLDLKVGQVVRGKTIASPLVVKVLDANGGELAALTLGEPHPKYGFGRYVAFKGETVLVADPLDGFTEDAGYWLAPPPPAPEPAEPAEPEADLEGLDRGGEAAPALDRAPSGADLENLEKTPAEPVAETEAEPVAEAEVESAPETPAEPEAAPEAAAEPEAEAAPAE